MQPLKSASGALQMPPRRHIDITTEKILTPVSGVAMGPFMTRMRQQIYMTWLTATLKAMPSLPQEDRALSATFWVTPTGNIEDAASFSCKLP